MATIPIEHARTPEIDILERLLKNGNRDMPPTLARYLLSLSFGEKDKLRMHELAEKNQKGALSRDEKEDLLGYAKAGCLLGILHSKARQSLKKPRH